MMTDDRNYPLVSKLLRGDPSWAWAPSLLARLALGIFFAISGGNKVFNEKERELLYKTIAEAGIPFAEINTIFISYVEFLCGLALIIGLLTAICCIALIGDMIVAILTVQLATIPSGLSFPGWLDDFLYLPEVTYIILFIWIVVSGLGRFSVDHYLARRLRSG
jgi:putative oxidoreductase